MAKEEELEQYKVRQGEQRRSRWEEVYLARLQGEDDAEGTTAVVDSLRDRSGLKGDVRGKPYYQHKYGDEECVIEDHDGARGKGHDFVGGTWWLQPIPALEE